MIGHLDFTAGPAVVVALIAAALFPALLAALSRLPRLRARNALQFLATSVIVVALWVIALCFSALRASSAAELATSFMILASALIIYLEIWALLSRGYTLGLLLTLFRGKAPMSDAQLAASYRQGEGVGWIMRHGSAGSSPRGWCAGKAIASFSREPARSSAYSTAPRSPRSA